MSTLITVDLRDATPPYEQIRAQIASLIAVGQLADGSRLPTVRALAGDLGVATGTVARAYKELEAAGLIESRRRLGTVVTHSSSSATEAADSPLEKMLDELINQARSSGVEDENLLSLLRGRMRTLDPAIEHANARRRTHRQDASGTIPADAVDTNGFPADADDTNGFPADEAPADFSGQPRPAAIQPTHTTLLNPGNHS